MKHTLNRTLTVAVAGNPNSGKTTIFNNLTGSRQKVGNYPGVTVEYKEGTLKQGDLVLRMIDLPGTYSLTAYSDEELVARDFLLVKQPDVVIDVVDAGNLERNLFLATELLEMDLPLILVLNMTDMADQRGVTIDYRGLAERLGVPVVPAVGNRGVGMSELVETISLVTAHIATQQGPAKVCRQAGPGPSFFASPESSRDQCLVNFGAPIEGYLARMEQLLPPAPGNRWRALKLLQGDAQVLEKLDSASSRQAAIGLAEAAASDCGQDELETQLAGFRYQFIEKLCAQITRTSSQGGSILSDRIDRVAMHPFWGVPIFLLLMFLVFTLTFSLGNPLMNQIDLAFGWLGGFVNGLWNNGGDSPLRSLLVDGIIRGVGGVVVFLPNILLLFLAIAVLEGTGYIARAAFVMDRFMSKVGLHGKSFIPLLIGFGCTVPAIMATRTLETRRDRLITMMVLPLISCGARLPIYALLIPAFFPARLQGPVLWVIYVTGIVLALLGARLLRATVFRGETTPFVMELPPYHLPTLGSLLTQMWIRARLYVQKAGTVILGAAIIMWFLTYYPKPPVDNLAAAGTNPPTVSEAVIGGNHLDVHEQQAEELSYSIAGRAGLLLEPVLRPLGFDWRIGTALIGALAAKEVFVAQMGIVFAVGEVDETSEHLRTRLQEQYSPLVGFCIMLFALISTPCLATFAITRQESGRIAWALAQAWGLTLLAWVLTFIVYQGGLLLGLGGF